MSYAFKLENKKEIPYITNISNTFTIGHRVRTRTLINGSNYGDYQAASLTNLKYMINLSLDKKYNKINSSYTKASKDNTYSDWKGGAGISTTAGFTGNHSGRSQALQKYSTSTTTITLSDGSIFTLTL